MKKFLFLLTMSLMLTTAATAAQTKQGYSDPAGIFVIQTDEISCMETVTYAYCAFDPSATADVIYNVVQTHSFCDLCVATYYPSPPCCEISNYISLSYVFTESFEKCWRHTIDGY